MAITVRTTLRSVFRAVFSGGGDYEAGPGVSGDNDDRLIGSGTGSYQADRVAKQEAVPLAGSGGVDVDLQTLTGPDGASIGAAEIVWMEISAPSTNPGNLRVSPSSSNGWTAFLSSSGSTDTPRIDIPPGAKIRIYGPVDGSYPVTGSDKSIRIDNTDAAAAAYTLTVLARSA